MRPDYVPNFSGCLLPYVQWYQDDFVGGVRGMKAHEIGIYTMLLMEMYARGQALNLSTERLARLCGADRRTFEKTLEMLIEDGKIIRLDCGIWNERCENAFRERAKMQEQQKSAAQTSWKNRRKINEPDKRPHSERNARAMPSSEAQIREDTNTNVLDAGSAPVDVRKVLFSEGLKSLQRQSGLSDARARSLLGKWLKAAGDDAAMVLIKIRQAEADQAADPVAWVTAALSEPSEYKRLFGRM